jgi:hypothetical protein
MWHGIVFAVRRGCCGWGETEETRRTAGRNGPWRIRVIAATWMALSRASCPGLSRWTVRCPEDTSIGAMRVVAGEVLPAGNRDHLADVADDGRRDNGRPRRARSGCSGVMHGEGDVEAGRTIRQRIRCCVTLTGFAKARRAISRAGEQNGEQASSDMRRCRATSSV